MNTQETLDIVSNHRLWAGTTDAYRAIVGDLRIRGSVVKLLEKMVNPRTPEDRTAYYRPNGTTVPLSKMKTVLNYDEAPDKPLWEFFGLDPRLKPKHACVVNIALCVAWIIFHEFNEHTDIPSKLRLILSSLDESERNQPFSDKHFDEILDGFQYPVYYGMCDGGLIPANEVQGEHHRLEFVVFSVGGHLTLRLIGSGENKYHRLHKERCLNKLNEYLLSELTSQ